MIKKSGELYGIKKKKKTKPLSDKEVQLALIENFVNLQRVLANLTEKFDYLSTNISSLLQLFEASAKTFMEKNTNTPNNEMDVLKKLDMLLDQNRTVAKGLTLIEEKIRHKVYGENVISKEEVSDMGMLGKPRPRPFPRV